MKVLKHAVASLVIFSILITLLVNVYVGLEDEYGITKNHTMTLTLNASNVTITGGMGDMLAGMNVIEGVRDLSVSIQNFQGGLGSIFDIGGALLAGGVGLIKIVTGLITAPFEFVWIMSSFYGGTIPAVLTTTLALIVAVYVGFILLSAYLGKEI